MGARGPLRILSPLQPVPDVLAGTAAAEMPPTAPAKPRRVAADPDLSELWDLVVPELEAAGLASPVDGLAIELTLRHYLVAVAAHEQIGGSVVSANDRGGPIRNPATTAMSAATKTFLELAKQTGMTLVARARTSTQGGGVPGDGDVDNPFTSHYGTGV